jgi:hypothetical protein
MGRCTAYGPKQAVLHLSEWRVSNPNQGIRQEGDSFITGELASDQPGHNLIGIRKHLQGQLGSIDVPYEPPRGAATETRG